MMNVLINVKWFNLFLINDDFEKPEKYSWSVKLSTEKNQPERKQKNNIKPISFGGCVKLAKTQI